MITGTCRQDESLVIMEKIFGQELWNKSEIICFSLFTLGKEYQFGLVDIFGMCVWKQPVLVGKQILIDMDACRTKVSGTKAKVYGSIKKDDFWKKATFSDLEWKMNSKH